MQATGIVEALDILEEVSAGLGSGPINPMVNALGFQAVKEALHWRVVLIRHLPHGSKAKHRCPPNRGRITSCSRLEIIAKLATVLEVEPVGLSWHDLAVLAAS